MDKISTNPRTRVLALPCPTGGPSIAQAAFSPSRAPAPSKNSRPLLARTRPLTKTSGFLAHREPSVLRTFIGAEYWGDCPESEVVSVSLSDRISQPNRARASCRTQSEM